MTQPLGRPKVMSIKTAEAIASQEQPIQIACNKLAEHLDTNGDVKGLAMLTLLLHTIRSEFRKQGV